jgi:hypothetical protein
MGVATAAVGDGEGDVALVLAGQVAKYRLDMGRIGFDRGQITLLVINQCTRPARDGRVPATADKKAPCVGGTTEAFLKRV